MQQTRDYEGIVRALEATPSLREEPRERRMRRVVDALWEALFDRGVSWVGFYLHDPTAREGEELVLGPRRDKPACSPIGLHGVCGQAFRTGEARIVRDVAELGDAYVACDPRDRSEIVLPLFEDVGGERRCWGVLDLDSFEAGAFDEQDEAGLRGALRAAGFDAG